MKRQHYYAVFLWVLVLSGLTACVSSPELPTPTQRPTGEPEATDEQPEPTDPPDTPAGPVSVRVNYDQPPSSLDPGRIAPLDAAANDLVENLFIGLTHLNPDAGIVEPWLAKEWELLEDDQTWHVFLRDDVHWVRVDPETGEVVQERPVTAEDVVYAALRACQPDTGAPLGSTPGVFVIQGCQDLYERDPATITDVFIEQNFGARVLNDVVVEFRLTGHYAYFPSLLAMPMLRPVPAELIEKNGEAWSDPENIWTSGPFALEPAELPGDGYRLVANEFWPIPRTGNVETAQFEFRAPDDAFENWQAGEIDVTTLPDEEVQQNDPAYQQIAQPATAMLVFAFDTPPLDDINVRRALALSLDREVLATVYRQAGVGAQPAQGAVPPGMVAAPLDTDYPPYAPRDARSSWAEAGYEDCADLPPIELLIDSTSEVADDLANAIVSMWGDALGCPDAFSVQTQLPFEVFTTLQEPASPVQPVRPSVILLGWQGDYPDAQHWLADVFACHEISPDAFVDAARSCAVVESDLPTAAQIDDLEERRVFYADIEEALFGPDGEMPVIPLVTFTRALAVQPWVELAPGSAGAFHLDEWIVREDAKP